LAKNFSDEIDKRLQMEKNRIQNEISQKIDAEKQKIQAQLDQFTANYTRLLQTQENELRKIEKNIATLQADAQSQVTAWQKEAEAKLEAEKNKVLDKAQKKLLDTFKKPF
jgi:vacuolar-type H+-ATPase subunit E/Vma4